MEHLPLNDAAATGDIGAVQSLVRNKPALINLKDGNGWQAIHEGSLKFVVWYAQFIGCFMYLIKMMLLQILAVRGGHIDVVKFLVENGSDIR